jgi:hypothetical protein
MLLPIADEAPLLICGVPYPEAAEGTKLCVGNLVRGNQEQRSTSGAKPLSSEGKFPRTLGTSMTLCGSAQLDLIRVF